MLRRRSIKKKENVDFGLHVLFRHFLFDSGDIALKAEVFEGVDNVLACNGDLLLLLRDIVGLG